MAVLYQGHENNYDHVKDDVDFPNDMDQIDKWILCDAVTSGGLLMRLMARRPISFWQSFAKPGWKPGESARS